MAEKIQMNFPAPVLAEPCAESVDCHAEAKASRSNGEVRGGTIPSPGSDSRGGELNLEERETEGLPVRGGSPLNDAPLSSEFRLENRLAPYDSSPPKSAKDLIIRLCDNKTAGRLNKAWHSRVPEITWGGTACNPCYCAVYQNIIYAVALWSCPIAGNRIIDGFRCLELRRMAIAPDAPRFTASRFLSIMVKMIRKSRPDVIKLISYQDTAVHKGTIYKASGWTLERQTEFVSWGITGRKGHGKLDYQAPSTKNRWALIIRDKGESDKLIKPEQTQDSFWS